MQSLFKYVSLWCVLFDPHPITYWEEEGGFDWKSDRITPAHLGYCGPKSVGGPNTKVGVHQINKPIMYAMRRC